MSRSPRQNFMLENRALFHAGSLTKKILFVCKILGNLSHPPQQLGLAISWERNLKDRLYVLFKEARKESNEYL